MKWTAENIRKDYGFDAVGVVKQGAKSIIVLGLETSTERDLDEFIGGNEELENWCYSGFKKYFSPKVDDLLTQLEKAADHAIPIAGYAETYKLKELAVKSGIGTQGRNSLVMNHKYQSKLRFRAIETSLKLETTGDGEYKRPKNPRCDECRLCELACAVAVLKDYKLIDKEKCLAYKQLTDRTPNLERCNLCWLACTRDYDWAEQKARDRDKIIRDMLPQNANMSHQ